LHRNSCHPARLFVVSPRPGPPSWVHNARYSRHREDAVAVVDPHGALVYFERMEDTQYASNDIAIGKARAAATYRRPTRAFMDVINKGGPATATLGGVYASPGGLPLMVDGKVAGAVGVSGVTGDQDEQCAKAGAGS
jgi:glc operon protein GlcG